MVGHVLSWLVLRAQSDAARRAASGRSPRGARLPACQEPACNGLVLLLHRRLDQQVALPGAHIRGPQRPTRSHEAGDYRGAANSRASRFARAPAPLLLRKSPTTPTSPAPRRASTKGPSGRSMPTSATPVRQPAAAGSQICTIRPRPPDASSPGVGARPHRQPTTIELALFVCGRLRRSWTRDRVVVTDVVKPLFPFVSLVHVTDARSRGFTAACPVDTVAGGQALRLAVAAARPATRASTPRSRGTSTSTGPTSVSTVVDRWPLRELPPFCPAGS